jgi:TetR/AcrR family transcriptional regulator, transcriptional repressor for nem operon
MSDYSEKALLTRERILRSAVELFYLHGYNATGVERVIAAAGVVKGNFYYHFKSKEVLALEALRWQREKMRRELGIGEARDGETPLHTLFSILQGMKAQVIGDGRGCQVRGCFFGNLALEMSNASEALRLELVASFDGLRDLFAKLISQAQRSGEVAADIDPQRTAAMALSQFQGAVLLSKTMQNSQELDRAIEFIRDYLSR